MAVRDIRLWPDPVLLKTCPSVALDDPDLPALIDDLFDTMYAANGRGLAAPQIGIVKSVFVVDVTWKEGAHDPRAFINPELITDGENRVSMDEQCLSIPGVPMPVTRDANIRLRWTGADGTQHDAEFDGMLARCIQHEFDHLHGKVIFNHQRPTARAEFEAQYAP